MATSLKIDDEMKGRIQALAQRRDRSAHWIMREAIREYVDREEARESFRQEAVDAWAAYRETGRYLSGEETFAWLERWGSQGAAGIPRATTDRDGRGDGRARTLPRVLRRQESGQPNAPVLPSRGDCDCSKTNPATAVRSARMRKCAN